MLQTPRDPKSRDSDNVWSKVSRQGSLALSSDISWPQLWDMARDRGVQGSGYLSAIIKVLTKQMQENKAL